MINLSLLLARHLGSRGCMLTFHRAAPGDLWASLPNRNFYLNLDFLDGLLGSLKRNNVRVVTIDQMLAALGSREDGPRLVNFSIDDCYRDTWEYVVPLFRRHGVPVTLFVTTGIPDGTLELGWAGLETILIQRDHVAFQGETIDVATSDAKRQAFETISRAWDSGGTFDSDYFEFCKKNDADPSELRRQHAITWDMLDTFRDDPLVEIGAHTVSHRRISTLPREAALEELAGSRERLRSRLGIECRHFAFPYGRQFDCGARDFMLASAAGYVSASTTRKGLLGSGQDLFSLPRNTLNGAYQSMPYFALTLSGMTGVAAKVLGRV